jgi:hypothetical protein
MIKQNLKNVRIYKNVIDGQGIWQGFLAGLSDQDWLKKL